MNTNMKTLVKSILIYNFDMYIYIYIYKINVKVSSRIDTKCNLRFLEDNTWKITLHNQSKYTDDNILNKLQTHSTLISVKNKLRPSIFTGMGLYCWNKTVIAWKKACHAINIMTYTQVDWQNQAHNK